MSTRASSLLLAAIALVSGCQNEIWLSEPDVGRAGHDAHVPPRDAAVVDAHVEQDSSVPRRACEIGVVPIARARDAGLQQAPTFAASGRRTTLRFAVLIPPAASATTTDDTRLVIVDDEGAPATERAIRIEDASGVSSASTLHSLSPLTHDEGFLLLGPRTIQTLDASAADVSEVALATGPSTVWQRSAGWLDVDRFVFVSDTPELFLAVFDRRTGEVTTTTLSAANAAAVHVDPGGVTISSAGPESEAVVFDPDLSGTEIARIPWNDGSVLGRRLLASLLVGGEWTWVVHDASEFRTNITSYRIAPPAPPAARATMPLLGPLTSSREGPFLAVVSFNPAVAIYAFETETFSTLARDFAGSVVVEHERDGANVAILFVDPAGAGETSLGLACGRH